MIDRLGYLQAVSTDCLPQLTRRNIRHCIDKREMLKCT